MSIVSRSEMDAVALQVFDEIDNDRDGRVSCQDFVTM
jgi:Ca2+-binding EF-hand superfamily protein